MKKLSELDISPVPWTTSRIIHPDLIEFDTIAADGAGMAIFDCCDEQFRSEVGFANARLISAAPDLYEALREIYEDFVPMCNVECHGCKHEIGCNKWAARARAALEKAGGAE